jgi:hypothetical protein
MRSLQTEVDLQVYQSVSDKFAEQQLRESLLESCMSWQRNLPVGISAGKI